MVIIYDFKVTKTNFILGKLKEVTVTGRGIEAVFVRKNNEVDIKPGQNVPEMLLGLMKKAARDRFKEEDDKRAKKLPDKSAATQKKPRAIFIPDFANVYDEAHELHKEILDYKKRHWSLTNMSDAVIEVLREGRNNSIRWQVLDNNMMSDVDKSEMEWYWMLRRKVGITPLTEGWTQVIRWEKRAGKKPKRIPQKVESIKHAIRQAGHALDTYKLDSGEKPGELKLLDNIEDVIREANRLIIVYKGLSKGDKFDLQVMLAKTILQIENCRNPYKQKIKEEFEKILPLKDSLNRINPGALAARTIKALGLLNKRFVELDLTVPHLAMRRELLVLEERRLQKAILNCLAKTHLAFHTKGYSQHNDKIIKNLNLARKFLSNVRTSPYWEIGRQANLYIYNAERFAKKRDQIGVKEMLSIAIGILETKVTKGEGP